MPMSQEGKENVILFPKTIEFYQVKLTRMLEAERYAEAIELLQFLLQCKGEDHTTYEEWKTLLDWLQTQAIPMDESEEDVLDQNIKHKIESDQYYIEKLLELVTEEAPLEKKMLALDQLSFAEHPQLENTLRQWLQEPNLHPLVQYKILQTLKKKGATGSICFQRKSDEVCVDIQRTPIQFSDYPESVHRVLQLVHEVCEVHHPALSYFAEQIWKEFLACAYGTAAYDQVTRLSGSQLPIWAASLHQLSEEMMLGHAESDHSEVYELTAEVKSDWAVAYKTIKQHFNSALPKT